MIVNTTDYADFKALVTALLTDPTVVGNTNVRWYAAAFTSTDAVTVSLDEEPAAFASDFPAHTDTAGPFTVG